MVTDDDMKNNVSNKRSTATLKRGEEDTKEALASTSSTASLKNS